jgi:hypothetical protein
MSRAVWLALGIGVGFAAAHKANETARGRAFFERVDARLTEFTDAVVDGYRGHELELRGIHSDPTGPPAPAAASRDSTTTTRDGQSPR